MKKRVLLTGAAGGMGYESLKQMLEDKCDYEIVALDLPNDKTYEKLEVQLSQVCLITMQCQRWLQKDL